MTRWPASPHARYPIPPPVDEELERDVLGGICIERYQAADVFAKLPADVFAARALHPYIYGTLRRLNKLIVDRSWLVRMRRPTPDRPHRSRWEVTNFAEAFKRCYPAVDTADLANEILSDSIEMSLGLVGRDIYRLLELRERRRLIPLIEERAREVGEDAERDGPGKLNELHELASLLRDVTDRFTSLRSLEPRLAVAGLSILLPPAKAA